MLVDLHAHYPMHLQPPREADTHAWVLERWADSAWRSVLLQVLSHLFNYQGPGGGPGVTVELMRQGNVGAALSVLYAPFDEMDLHQPYGAPPLSRYVQSLREQMKTVEAEVAREAAHGRAALARNPAELDAAIEAGRVAIVHCIEGGHALGASEAEIAATVAEFAGRGVAYITLAHLFYRGVAQNAPALPFMPDWLYRLTFPQKGSSGLTRLGAAAVRAMAEHHVLVDVTHMNARAVAETLKLLDGVPVIASHIACRMKGGHEYNLSDDVIAEIGRRGGVMGVIVCRHWANDGLPKARSFADSVNVVCEHIERIRRVTRSDEHVAVGTDLDGYIKPALPGLEHEGRMKAFGAALGERYGAALAEKFLSGNTLGLLRRYWRGAL